MRNFNPTYKIDLKNLFDRTYAGNSQQLRDRLRPLLKIKDLRDSFATRVIDEINTRTADGIDKNGAVFKRYSLSYTKSLFGQAYGKTLSTRPNLRATGSMLSDMEQASTFNQIIFSFGEQDNRNKARGHITGFEGKLPRAKRDFFGLPKSIEEKLLRDSLKDFSSGSLRSKADLFDFMQIFKQIEALSRLAND